MDPRQKPVAEVKYVCEMGCTTSEMAGKCPKCGRRMSPVEGDKKTEKHQY